MRIVHAGPKRTAEPVDAIVRPGSVIGSLAALLFLREAPLPGGTVRYVLPGFDPRFVATPKAGGGNLPSTLAE